MGVAMTDGQDIKTCKVVRKLEVDEKFTTSGEQIEDSESGVTRVKGTALKDNKEGWCTVKGNKGSVYMASAGMSSKTYTAQVECDIMKSFGSGGGGEVRKLAAEEKFQVIEGPKEEKSQPDMRIKVRVVSDSAVGWLSRSDGTLKKYSGA